MLTHRYRIEVPAEPDLVTGYRALHQTQREAVAAAQRLTHSGQARLVMVWDMAASVYVHTERA